MVGEAGTLRNWLPHIICGPGRVAVYAHKRDNVPVFGQSLVTSLS